MTFFDLIRQILKGHPEGMTPQQIREIIKVKHPTFYNTESHRRNVAKKYYKDIDHALLAQIYSASRVATQIVIDKTKKPIKLILSTSNASDVNISDERINTENFKRTKTSNISQKTKKSDILTPHPDLLSQYLAKWEQLENYRLQEASLGILFHEMCPENVKIEHVLLKVSALNDFYSTNIFDTYSVAKHILEKNIDMRLEANDYTLVNDIAEISIKGKTKNFYSFASKYCSHHKPTIYPIFDSYVEKMLLYYKSIDDFSIFAKPDLKEYELFIEIIKTFQNFYKLNKFSLREIDIFLWLAGKEWFPKKF